MEKREEENETLDDWGDFPEDIRELDEDSLMDLAEKIGNEATNNNFEGMWSEEKEDLKQL